VVTPPELQFPLAVTACLMMGNISLYVARSGGERYSRTCRWDVRIFCGNAMLTGGSIVFLASGVAQCVRTAAQIAMRHGANGEAIAWCHDKDLATRDSENY
jgi:hypothetical protein